MIQIDHPELFRIVQTVADIQRTENAWDKYLIYSFFAEPDSKMNRVSKTAFCSIILLAESSHNADLIDSGKFAFWMDNIIATSKHARDGGIKISLALNADYHLLKLDDHNGLDHSIIDRILGAISSDVAEGMRLLGDIQYMVIKESNSNTVLIGALPLSGIITPIRRADQYILDSGKLVVLDAESRIHYDAVDTLDPNYFGEWGQRIPGDVVLDIRQNAMASKVVYLAARIQDVLRIEEYCSSFHTAYRMTHEYGHSSGTPIAVPMAWENWENNPAKSLFKIRSNVNLFHCGPIFGVRRKGEIVTRIESGANE